jgi:hypothetical protein
MVDGSVAGDVVARGGGSGDGCRDGDVHNLDGRRRRRRLAVDDRDLRLGDEDSLRGRRVVDGVVAVGAGVVRSRGARTLLAAVAVVGFFLGRRGCCRW